MSNDDPSVPYGYCECGCGRQTTRARQTDTRLGYVRGEPVRFIRGHANRTKVRYIPEDRGFSSPCWIWQLWKTHEGYGKAYRDGSSVMAHRVEWERVNGPVPDGLHLDHLCRVTSCVNPDHLEPVTPAENTRRSTTAKLSRHDVAAIRERLAAGESQTALARLYGVTTGTINHIATGRNWADGD